MAQVAEDTLRDGFFGRPESIILRHVGRRDRCAPACSPDLVLRTLQPLEVDVGPTDQGARYRPSRSLQNVAHRPGFRSGSLSRRPKGREELYRFRETGSWVARPPSENPSGRCRPSCHRTRRPRDPVPPRWQRRECAARKAARSALPDDGANETPWRMWCGASWKREVDVDRFRAARRRPSASGLPTRSRPQRNEFRPYRVPLPRRGRPRQATIGPVRPTSSVCKRPTLPSTVPRGGRVVSQAVFPFLGLIEQNALRSGIDGWRPVLWRSSRRMCGNTSRTVAERRAERRRIPVVAHGSIRRADLASETCVRLGSRRSGPDAAAAVEMRRARPPGVDHVGSRGKGHYGRPQGVASPHVSGVNAIVVTGIEHAAETIVGRNIVGRG